MPIFNYLIQVYDEGDEWMAKVLRQTGSDQREGSEYKVMSVALDPDKDAALKKVVRKAFDLP